MKAAVWYGRKDVRVVDVPDSPSPGPGEVKIKVAWVGVCGTDLHEYAAGPIFMPIEPHPLTGKSAPLIAGHEFSGVIEEVGPDIDQFTPGDRVTADSATWCGECWACQRHEYSLCEKVAFLGLGRDGVFAQYITLPVAGVYHIPPELSLENASFCEPTAVALHALRRGRMMPGDNVLVIGAGNQGLLTWQILKHSGAHQVFVAARKGVRADLARQFGAEVLDPTEIDVVAEIKDRTNGVGVDLAVETAAQPETVTMALEATRKLGRVVEVGIFEKPATFELNDLVFQERELIGIINNSGEFPQAIQMMADGRVDPGPMISSRISLENVVEKGFEECIRNKRANVKVIVNCNEDLCEF
ncbi:MAG: 2,3-butanediol dehydrogenase [Desulfobacterales bacterium]|jgi:(R,R)-butanediol dehydrogenase/meso-butanediol dehydrogenase/diacetyl reductase